LENTVPQIALTSSDLLKRAIESYQAGHLDQAEAHCNTILSSQVDHFDALYLLAIIRSRLGHLQDALAGYDKALRVKPHNPEVLHSRAITLQRLNRFDEALASYDEALAIKPGHVEALINRGIALQHIKRFDEALASYDKALAIKPDYAEALNNRGITLQHLKRFQDALASYDKALDIRPKYADALVNRGIVLQHLKRFEDALTSYEQALAIAPGYADVLNSRGAILQNLQRFEDALASYDSALVIKPDYVEALVNRGITLQHLKRLEEALVSYDKALTLYPDHAEALNNRGVTLQELKRFEDSLASYDKALAIKPDYAEVLNNRGNVLRELLRFEEALASYDMALAVKPEDAEILNRRGITLQQLKRFEEALASYDKALAINPDYADALNNRGITLQDLNRLRDALANYDKALTIRPNYADALYNRGVTLRRLNRFEDGLASYDKALLIEPNHRYAFGALADSALQICDWARSSQLDSEIEAHIAEQKSIISPLVVLGYWTDALLQLNCAKNWIQSQIPVLPPPMWSGTSYQHERIRLAYLSGDFRRHAVANLIVQLFERHDRTQFELLGVSFGPDDKSDMRARLVKSFDQFYDVRSQADHDVAKLLNGLQVDIAVDLMGHTHDARPGILAHRPAPIQINYLGYPGTMGADFIDYVIADQFVLPFEQQPFYTEKIIQLPECYQANDSQRRIADRTPTRREAGLPDGGFVFCCFNNNYKITAPVFDAWMRLLRAVRGSVLWLLADNVSAQSNLCKAAAARGIDPGRLAFAGRLPSQDHLARHRLADLFLDTLPYNAHTTASDALWAGLPLVSCRGDTFAGRVGASLLNAIGLQELVTTNLQDYEALALQLATDTPRLQSVRRRLGQYRSNYPLFNTDRFRRHIEAAYLTAWGMWRRGESPRSFRVEALREVTLPLCC
jgi:predicted O-linked N-acetylglucosamine transferase (SPINDLY family)